MAKIRPAQWAAQHVSSGLTDLPRNGAWLLSKALRSPVVASGIAAHDTTDGLRRMTAAVADRVPGAPDTVSIKLRRAETAVTRAREAERQALAEAQAAEERAQSAKALTEAGKQRIREAAREGKQEVDQRSQEAREPRPSAGARRRSSPVRVRRSCVRRRGPARSRPRPPR